MENIYLSDFQRELVADNHDRIYRFMRKKSLVEDYWYDILAIALCKAATKWDSDRGAFSTITYYVMLSAMEHELRNSKKREFFQNQIRLDQTMDDGETELSAYIGGLDYDLEAVDFILDFREKFARLSKREQEVIRLKFVGFTQRKIAQIMGVSPAMVSAIANKAKAKIA